MVAKMAPKMANEVSFLKHSKTKHREGIPTSLNLSKCLYHDIHIQDGCQDGVLNGKIPHLFSYTVNSSSKYRNETKDRVDFTISIYGPIKTSV